MVSSLIRNFLYFLPEGILLGVGFLVLLLDPFLKESQKPFLGKLSCAGLLGSFAATLFLWNEKATLFNALYLLDGYSLFFKALFSAAAFLTLLISFRYLTVTGIPQGEYFALLLFATVGMMVMAAGVDFLSLYLGLEVMAISSYALVGLLKKERASLEGALKYFLLGAFNSGLILYGIALFYGIAGTTRFSKMATFFPELFSEGPPPTMFLVAMGFLIAGFAFKISAFPFHMWVPDAYEGSPPPIAGFISVASKAAGFAALLRVLLHAIAPFRSEWQPLIVLLSILTMTFGNLLALTQESLKRMLAYSSIAHAGYLLIGLVVGTPLGLSAILFYFVAYAAMNLGAFAMIVLIHPAASLEDLRGLAKHHPVWAFCFLIFLLSLAGIPPSAGFIGKFYLFAGAIQSGFYGLAIIAVLNSVLAFSYYFRMVQGMYMMEERHSLNISPSWALRFSLLLLACLTLLAGLCPTPFLRAAQEASRSLL